MSFADKIGAVFSRKRLAILAGFILLYCFWIYGVSTNPAGFYVDESCIAYNGYLLAKTGAQEDGKKFPLYIHCYTQGYSQYMSAAQPYELALMYLFVPPSIASARICAASTVFAAMLLLGFLAARISGRTSVGIIVALSGLATPWLFDFSRLVMELFFFIFAVVLFLFCVYNAYSRGRWKFTDCFFIAISLTLLTFSYASGRALAPILALGLLLFAVNWRALFDVFKVWAIYAVTMIPMVVVYLKDPLVISGRFWRTTNISVSKSFLENAVVIFWALYEDFSLKYFVIEGDVYIRHHVPGTGQFLVGTFALGILGLVIILMRHRSSPWWRYVIFGLFASLVPGAITSDRHASIRGLAFALFFLLLTIPAVSWLIGLYDERSARSEASESNTVKSVDMNRQSTGFLGVFNSPSVERYLRLGLLSALLLLTAVQAVRYQSIVRSAETAASRAGIFHEAYPGLLDEALAEGSRPIYLQDYGEPAYMHALWYGAIKGIDRSDFVHLLDRQYAPEGALVLSSGDPCLSCEHISQAGGFALFRNNRSDGATTADTTTAGIPISAPVTPKEFTADAGPEGQLSNPRGIAADMNGNVYVADTGNGRIQKFGADGKFIVELGKTGPSTTVLKEPNGIVVDPAGMIYVVDASTHTLLKFDPEGAFIAAHHGPDTGFYGPRDVAVGPNGQLYIVDQGRSRIARFDPATSTYSLVWGSAGSGEGQFSGPTGITVGNDLVYVTDLGNSRIQIFDLEGRFIQQWEIPSWKKLASEFPDVAFDAERKSVYVSGGDANEVLVFDLEGNPVGRFDQDRESNNLDNPSSLAVVGSGDKPRLYVLSTGRSMVSVIELEPVKKAKGGRRG